MAAKSPNGRVPKAAPEPARTPGAPKFGICQGTKEELERTGTAVDPFTGQTLTRGDDK